MKSTTLVVLLSISFLPALAAQERSSPFDAPIIAFDDLKRILCLADLDADGDEDPDLVAGRRGEVQLAVSEQGTLRAAAVLAHGIAQSLDDGFTVAGDVDGDDDIVAFGSWGEFELIHVVQASSLGVTLRQQVFVLDRSMSSGVGYTNGLEIRYGRRSVVLIPLRGLEPHGARRVLTATLADASNHWRP